MFRARALPVAVLIVALAASACSSDRTSRIDASPTPSSPDLTLAQHAVLRSSDVGGYRANKHTAQTDLSATLKRKFAKCTGAATTILDTEPGSQTAYSPDFSKGQTNEQQMTSSVVIHPKATDVDRDWNGFAGDKAKPCLEQVFKELKPAGDANGRIKYGPLQVSEFEVGVGDRSIGYAISRSATGPGQIFQLDVDMIYVARDRAGMEFNFFNYGPNPDRAAEKKLAQKVYDRIGDKAA
jgi:hypothetical protein